MARPRSFDEDQVLECAMMTFWRLGFDATTYKVLEGQTGVGVRSMHNTFGEKEDLFVRSLDAYHAMAKGIIDQVFDPPSAAAIKMMFGAMVAEKDPDDIANAGCLMVNTVFEIGEKPDAIADRIAAYRAMWLDTFQDALRHSGIGQVEARAEFLLGSLWGVLSQIRLAGRAEAAAPTAEIVIQTVDTWLREGDGAG